MDNLNAHATRDAGRHRFSGHDTAHGVFVQAHKAPHIEALHTLRHVAMNSRAADTRHNTSAKTGTLDRFARISEASASAPCCVDIKNI